jgi:hypothetical protein
MRERTGSRTWLRAVLGAALGIAEASVGIVFSAEPGDDITWGLRAFAVALIVVVVLTILLITWLGLDYLRLLLPWYGLPTHGG